MDITRILNWEGWLLLTFFKSALRFAFIARTGIISAALVISRRLSLASTNEVGINSSRTQKTRMVLGDLVLGMSFPLAQLIICEAFPVSLSLWLSI